MGGGGIIAFFSWLWQHAGCYADASFLGFGNMRDVTLLHLFFGFGNMRDVTLLHLFLALATCGKHKGKRLLPYFLCYIRVFGMSQGGTNRFCFVKAPLKLVPRGAKPPVESVSEVLQSKLLTKVGNNSQCFTDGCLSWESAAKK